ncbi:MAG: NADH-quinone oxidoreductase subunit D [Puniceicoccales bacterium]|jgi:NADH-quinone oxidoreductase subunit D|nr:NADH-quinone oxidoreductase subunit D [Puniceicoccales bacterium]
MSTPRHTTTTIGTGDAAARAAEAFAQASPMADGRLRLNMGPSHPATHGVLRLKLELDGDIVTRCEPVIGYLHRGIEKLAESMTYNQFVTCTDRLDYLAPLANNVAWVCAVEKLANIQVPPRCEAIRVICAEMARVSSHLLGLGVYGMDTGAWTVFMYTFTEREKLHLLFEQLTGARFTTSHTRVGGLARDLPDGWLDGLLRFCDELPRTLDEVGRLLTRNKIFIDRTRGIGVIPPALARSHAISGANLRASGIAEDLRKDAPYSGYERYDFDIPTGTVGDCYDRYLVRMEEVRQSIRILRQAATTMPGGAWHVENAPRVFPPPKSAVQTGMEELIQNFALVTRGPALPAGEVWFEAENPKGALAFYIHSKGGGTPWRVRIRGGSHAALSLLPALIPGHRLTDIPAILGSIDFVMGECDR